MLFRAADQSLVPLNLALGTDGDNVEQKVLLKRDGTRSSQVNSHAFIRSSHEAFHRLQSFPRLCFAAGPLAAFRRCP